MTAPEPTTTATEPAELSEADSEAAALARILELYAEQHGGAPTDAIETAYEFARDAHAGQTRLTGEPFVLHPLAVAAMLARYGLDESTIVAAMLHDTVEDTEVRLEQIEERFGHEVAVLIDGVTKLDRISFQNSHEHQAATIRKMVIAMAKDVRVLLIKLADRLHNLRTIEPFKREKQERIALETLEIYAPLAHRLGVQEMKHEMEDRCFKILHPRRYAEIDDLLARRAPAREGVIEAATREVSAALASSGVDGQVSGRPKHRYSIYR